MDLVKVLELLTGRDKKNTDQSEKEDLGKILEKAFSLLSEDVQTRIKVEIKEGNENNKLWQEYLYTILFILKDLDKRDLAIEENLLSVSQYQTIKKSIGIAAAIGIAPCLLTGIGIANTSTHLPFPQFSHETLTIMQKYQRLSDTSRVFSDCFYNLSLRPVLLPHLGSLFAGLLQLSFAPLKKPESDCAPNISASNSEFKMTSELYSKLKTNQEEFHSKLMKLIEECPQNIVMKELMILNGAQKSPRWLKVHLTNFLINGIIKPNGVISLIQAVCEDTCESGTSWEKLDVVARLIAASHGNNSEGYYNSVCSQLLEILASKNLKYGATIANTCISALYQFNPDVCIRKIFRVITRPFLVKSNNEESTLKTEEEVTICIETLSKCFLSTEAAFKTLPAKLMLEISIPLFHLHLKAAKSISAYREKIRQLLLEILSDEWTREITFSAFLNHEIPKSESKHFGNKLSFEFGPTGGFKITGKNVDLNHEELADCIFDLVQSNETLASSLFTYLLKSLSTFRNAIKKNEILNNEIDAIERVEKQLAAVKLLSRLSSSKIVQDAQIKNPRPLLSFVKSLFEETHLKSAKETEDNADAFDILYISLMLVKVILTDRGKSLDWEPFEEFSSFLGKEKSSGSMPEHVISLVNEIINIDRAHSTPQRFYDLSADSKRESDFDKALKDLADPLLPVRAHGIISLTKLVEASNSDVIAKRDVLIYLFQENLKHEDSFIYLAAVNGVCALAMLFPQKVIEILVQEFIDMPQRTGSGEITPETRAKLGEILMKTTRSLGEMAPKYKSLLVNAFLCGTRDPDPLVRSSSLSCLGELCKVLGFRVGNLITEILYCIGCIIKTDKEYQCRRAGVLVATLLLRGLGKEMLSSLGSDLVVLYRGLKHLRDNDEDSVLRLHAQLALEEFDDVVQSVLFAKPKLQKTLFLLHD